MKKIVILICCILMLLTSCNFDRYSNQRPADYGEALWTCDEYNIWFLVDFEKEDFYLPEGEILINNNKYFCKFYFIHQTNQLHISIYPIEYATIPDEFRNRNAVIGTIKGSCNFSNESFTFFINKTSGDIFDRNVKEMKFQRIEIPCE